MRAPVFAVLGFVLTGTPVARADDPADTKAAKEIIARGLRASGWADTDTPPNLTWKDTGTLHVGGMTLSYTAVWSFHAPDELRFERTIGFMGRTVKTTHVVSGSRAWDVADGRVTEETGDRLRYSVNQPYRLAATRLTPLLHDGRFVLKPAGEKTVNDRPVVGVRVGVKGRPVLTLYFDKETGLLAKTETRVRDEFRGWKDAVDEAYYDDWKVVAGHKEFSKVRVVRNRKPLVERNLSDVRTPDMLDPRLFEMP